MRLSYGISPVYGYLYGAIQTGEGNIANIIQGIVFLASPDGSIKYYEFADRTDAGMYLFLNRKGK